MDGHMSKASRDLSRGVGVKSNGLKYGGGNKEGECICNLRMGD